MCGLAFAKGHSAQGWTLPAGPPPPSAGLAPAGNKIALIMKTRVSGREGQGDAFIYCQGLRNTSGNGLYRCCGATERGGVDETPLYTAFPQGAPALHPDD